MAGATAFVQRTRMRSPFSVDRSIEKGETKPRRSEGPSGGGVAPDGGGGGGLDQGLS